MLSFGIASRQLNRHEGGWLQSADRMRSCNARSCTDAATSYHIKREQPAGPSINDAVVKVTS